MKTQVKVVQIIDHAILILRIILCKMHFTKILTKTQLMMTVIVLTIHLIKIIIIIHQIKIICFNYINNTIFIQTILTIRHIIRFILKRLVLLKNHQNINPLILIIKICPKRCKHQDNIIKKVSSTTIIKLIILIINNSNKNKIKEQEEG